MELSLFYIVLLILCGAITGISMSFIGQTGSGIVIPVVFLLTGDILLAIATNLLNDLIAAGVVAINYVRHKNYLIKKDDFKLIGISILTSVACVYILLKTGLSNSYGVLLPLMFIVIGIGIMRKGFPTAESIKRTVHKLTERFFKGKKSEEEIKELEQKMDAQLIEGENIIEGVIPPNSKLFYISIILVGIMLGGNSGLFGAGGGFIVAVLLLFYGYPLKKAVGTGLLITVLICASTFMIYQLFGFVIKGRLFFDWSITLYLAIGSIVAGLIASKYVQKLSAKSMGMGMGLIMVVLGAFILVINFMK